MTASKTVAVAAGLASAACWGASAAISIPPAVGAYWGMPVVDPNAWRHRLTALLNGVAAFLSALAILAQEV